jgi:hypothetical protein
MSSLKSIAQEVVDKAGKTGISIPSIDSANGKTVLIEPGNNNYLRVFIMNLNLTNMSF